MISVCVYLNIFLFCSSDFNSSPASVDFCRLLMVFANSLDPGQARQNVGPDLDPSSLILQWYSPNYFLK